MSLARRFCFTDVELALITGGNQIRIYGMTYFNEHAPYWGDTRNKIMNDNRLTARSVKIFADGEKVSASRIGSTFYRDCAFRRCAEIRRCCGEGLRLSGESVIVNKIFPAIRALR